MKTRSLRFLIGGLLAAAALAAFLSPFASSSPDGLEKIAADHGFLEKGDGPPVWSWSVVPDYIVPHVGDERVATGLAGLAGTLLVFCSAYGLARLIRAKR